MHRHNVDCHWCGVLPRTSWQTAGFWRLAAGLLLSVSVAGATWRYGVPLASEAVSRRSVSPVVAAPEVAMSTAPAAPPSPTALDAAPVVVPAAPIDSVITPEVSGDSAIVWTPAVARTWVNVRDAANRDAQVVGVIKPASRAMLGTDRSGWRRVRSPDVHGWVDPRLFEANSLKSRGE
jgi:hypothetical protein